MTDGEKEAKLQELVKWENHFEWKYVADYYKPRLLLDFGCGYGFSDIYLAMAGFEVVGYDIDAERIEIARYIRDNQTESVRNKVQFYQSAIPVRDYALIWLSHTLEHIPMEQWYSEFSLIWRSCKVDGVSILVSVPWGDAYDMPEHVNHWLTNDELVECLQKHTGLPWRAWTDTQNMVIKAQFGGE